MKDNKQTKMLRKHRKQRQKNTMKDKKQRHISNKDK